MPKKDFLEFSFENIGFGMLAIHTAHPAPVFAWNCDHVLGTSFSLTDPPFLTELRKQESSHIRYSFTDEEFKCTWWLLENQGSSGLLLPSRPAPDFLLVGDQDASEQVFDDWLGRIRQITGVSMAYEVSGNDKGKLYWVADLLSPPMEEE